MTPGKIGIGVVCALVAFGAAFGIGSATSGGDEKAAAAESAERVELDGTAPKAANLDAPGSIPALRAERRRPAGGGGGGGAPSPAPAPPPSSPPPSSPPPSSPPPSSPPPSSPPPIIEG